MSNTSTTSERPTKQVEKYKQSNGNTEERNEKKFKCKCGKIFLTSQQLSCHEKTCTAVNGDNSVLPKVSEQQCKDWRSMVKNGISTTDILDNCRYSSDTIRTHIRGGCSHSDSDIVYDASKRMWVHERHKKLKACECGKKFLTDRQLNAHKQSCDEVGSDGNSGNVIPEEVCSKWRKTLGQYDSVPDMAKHIDYSVYALRRHIRGDCTHDGVDFYWEFTGRHWEARQD